MSEALLKVERVEKSFGGVMALRGVSFEVRRGQIKALIGPNGAVKTTLFH
ncbi:MAG TPA: ATP-binding cassette domain-containing protein, partial [Candidatus Latescibacteria bacterium]|nr:ATP-binding cassette domain-containing protein [Candidatus Latescibacterota bacterium]